MEKKVSGIYVYPIKSCRGVGANSARVTSRGLEFDRQWMVVDKRGGFLSQRKLRKMALIQPSLVGKCLVLDAPGMPQLWEPIGGNPGKAVDVRVHKDICQGIDQGEVTAWWFSRFLGLECAFVRMADDYVRTVKGERHEGQISYADADPFLVVSKSSLDDLNSRMEDPSKRVPMNRFRPNLVVEGCDPHEEDAWEEVRIGDILLLGNELCIRCNIPGINQDTGEPDKEPLRTLKKYRSGTRVSSDGKKTNEIFFGRSFTHQSHGEIRVGDTVEVQRMGRKK